MVVVLEDGMLMGVAECVVDGAATSIVLITERKKLKLYGVSKFVKI